jgi:Cys-tRNA(Pro)/Cys-tRNA(Cys) deacylase
MKTWVMEKLEELQIPYKIKPHSKPVYTSEEAAQERGVKLSQIVKTMILMSKKKQGIIAVLPGDKKLDTKKVKKITGLKELRFLDRTAVEEKFGLVAGAIAPIKDLFPSHILLADPEVFAEDPVDISSGDPQAGLELSREDLRKLLTGFTLERIAEL